MRYRPPVSPTAAAAMCWGSREMQSLLEAAATYLNTLGPREMVWIGIGFLGQFLFMMRFLWQWVQSERQRRSIIPMAFGNFALPGGRTLLASAVFRLAPVSITGRPLGFPLYTGTSFVTRGE